MDTNLAIPSAPPIGSFLDEMDEKSRRDFTMHRQIDGMYITSPRDTMLAREIGLMVTTTIASLETDRPEGRVLAVIGEPGAGKTWAIERAIGTLPLLETRLLSITAPSQCNLNQLGRTILAKLGYALKREVKEHIVWEMVRDKLPEHGIRFLWVDELQHVFRHMNPGELQRISDTIKSLAQRRQWPLGIIMSGLPVLSSLLKMDRQIERRSHTLTFGRLNFPDHVGHVRHLLTTVIEKQAGLKLDTVFQSDELIHRVCHATDGTFGVIISMTRQAVFVAIDRENFDGTVRVADFAVAYARERDCLPSQNVLTADKWHEIVPGNSRLRDDGNTPATSPTTPAKRGASRRK